MVRVYCDSCMREIKKGDKTTNLVYRFSPNGISVELLAQDPDEDFELDCDESEGEVAFTKQLHTDYIVWGCIQRAWLEIIGEYNEYINKDNQPSEDLEMPELPSEDNQPL